MQIYFVSIFTHTSYIMNDLTRKKTSVPSLSALLPDFILDARLPVFWEFSDSYWRSI